MEKQEVYKMLEENKIKYEVIEHDPVYTIEDMLAIPLPHPEQIAKNLFVRDDKKRNYYLITARESKQISLNDFAKKYGLRRLSFANEEDLEKKLGLKSGSVTPFGLFNQEEPTVQLFLDRGFDKKSIAVHPNENTATVYMNTKDLTKLLDKYDLDWNYVDL